MPLSLSGWRAASSLFGAAGWRSSVGAGRDLAGGGGRDVGKQGQWRRKIRPGDFVLQGDAATRAGLVNPTAFQLDPGVVLKLPWTTDFFDPAPGKRTPVMGAVDFSSERIRTLFKNAATREFKQHLNSPRGA